MPNEKVDQALEQLIAMFEEGTFPDLIARTVIERSRMAKPSDSWSIGNQILQFLAGTSDGRTYKAWQEVGRQVRKKRDDEEQLAFYILRPVKKTIRYQDEETGETVKKQITLGFQETPRFRVEDTEGEPIEYPTYEPMELPPLAEVAEEMGLTVEYKAVDGDYYGYYQPNAEYIALCTHDATVFWHELAHAAHKRVMGELKNGQDKDQEIVAETVAAVLSLMYGQEGYLHNCEKYIAGYARGEKPLNAIMRVLSQVQSTLDLILSYANDRQEVAA